jgi:LPS sulfotransferase NodH
MPRSYYRNQNGLQRIEPSQRTQGPNDWYMGEQMKTCPPCHGECNQGRACPAETHPAYEHWQKWFPKQGIQPSRFIFSRTSHGKAYRAGYDAGMEDAKKVVKDGEEWKLWDTDQA